MKKNIYNTCGVGTVCIFGVYGKPGNFKWFFKYRDE